MDRTVSVESDGSRRFPYFLLAVAVVALAGCASIPERDLENAFKYQRLQRADIAAAAPIASECQECADRAWKSQELGRTNQYVAILEEGDDALLARIHLIRAARKSIDIQTYIWTDDPTSRFVFDELVKAAERGVLVRVLIDALNMPAPPERLARMARAHRNIEICLYKPLSDYAEPGPFGFWDNLILKARHMNRRMHNKLLLVDGHIGIAGGRNYEAGYYDRDPAFLFRDRDVLVAGPAVRDMQVSFEMFWQDKNAVFLTQLKDVQEAFARFGNGGAPFADPRDAWMFEEVDRLANRRSLAEVRPALAVHEVRSVRFIYDTPRKFRGGERMDFDAWFEKVLGQAKERLVYQTPYLLYNRDVRAAFNRAHKTNPNFRIVASSNSLASSDHVVAFALSFKYRKELYEDSGIDIYEAKPYPAARESYVNGYATLAERFAHANGGAPADPSRPGPPLCIHAKSFVVDRRIALVGSHNFDPRSAKLNTECGVCIEDPVVAGLLEDAILNACEPRNAWTVAKAPSVPVVSYFSGLIGAISTALPVFDVWPYRYTTDYELRPGREPLPPRDPGFQERYRDVGAFPGVDDTTKAIGAQLMKAFGGWAQPLM